MPHKCTDSKLCKGDFDCLAVTAVEVRISVTKCAINTIEMLKFIVEMLKFITS